MKKGERAVNFYITEEYYECPKCGGEIMFESDQTPGFCCRDWYPCRKCGYDIEKEVSE